MYRLLKAPSHNIEYKDNYIKASKTTNTQNLLRKK